MELAPPARFADTIVLKPVGRIDYDTATGFRDWLVAAVGTRAPGARHVVLDLSAVDYIASIGLRALLVASRQAKTNGASLTVAALHPVVKEIFDIARFGIVLEVFASVPEALRAVSGEAFEAYSAPRPAR
jgi:anti-anti-sigma factor